MFSLSGKTAVITGSSRGIGRAIAEQMASLGAKVVISSRKAEACEIVAAGIRESGGEALVVPCDIAEKAQLENLLERTLEAFGQLDILVCNAAVNPFYGPMAKVTDDVYERIMNSNVKSTFWLCNMAASHMADADGGSITIISSIGGNQGSPNLGVYGMSKAADFALTRNLAVEWGPKGIRANCIAPGLIKTDFSRALWENETMHNNAKQRTPLQRLGKPEDIGGVACFLSSPAAAYLTGQTLVVDGGLTICEPA